MGKDVIIACDFSSAQARFDFLDKFTEEKFNWIKRLTGIHKLTYK